MWIKTILIYFCFILGFVTSVPSDLGDVVFVTLIFRHGDRTPIKPYPNDPYKNNSLWPTGWGELTNVGKRGHYNLGKWLRKRYKDLLPESYKKGDIHIQSTDVDRTLMSAYSNLAGLYEPNPDSNWNPDIRWTPIPVHTIPETMDKVLAGKAPCPKYKSEMEKLLISKEFQKINEKYKELYAYLSENTGTNVTNVIEAEEIRDTLFIESLNNFTLPNWTKTVYPEPLKTISELTFSIDCYTPLLARLKIGPLLGEILNHMRHKISMKEKFSQKVWMYSAHDTTIANVLKSLNLFQPHCPPYLSLIMFELRKKNDNYFVAIHYRNSSTYPPFFLQLEGCDKLCPFNKFENILSAFIPKDWEHECLAIRFAEGIYSTAASISVVTIVSLALLFSLSVAIAIKFHRNHKWNKPDFAYRSLKTDVTS